MGLDFTGPIKWSEIVAEFGQPSSSTTTTFYNVPWVKWTAQTAWVKSSLICTSNLDGLINDFQFLIFTFSTSIKLSFFLVVLYHCVA